MKHGNWNEKKRGEIEWECEVHSFNSSYFHSLPSSSFRLLSHSVILEPLLYQLCILLVAKLCSHKTIEVHNTSRTSLTIYPLRLHNFRLRLSSYLSKDHFSSVKSEPNSVAITHGYNMRMWAVALVNNKLLCVLLESSWTIPLELTLTFVFCLFHLDLSFDVCIVYSTDNKSGKKFPFFRLLLNMFLLVFFHSVFSVNVWCVFFFLDCIACFRTVVRVFAAK